jgi:chromosome segregation ATPase
MGKLNLNLIAMLVPLLIVAIGLIGWVTTLRGDVSAAQAQVVEVRADIKPLQDEAKQCAIEIHNLHELIKDIDKIEEVVDRVDVALFRLNSIEEEAQENAPAIAELEKNLAVANDQMRTIMADHMGFADVLDELNKSGILPSGERRAYGGYSN